MKFRPFWFFHFFDQPSHGFVKLTPSLVGAGDFTNPYRVSKPHGRWFMCYGPIIGKAELRPIEAKPTPRCWPSSVGPQAALCRPWLRRRSSYLQNTDAWAFVYCNYGYIYDASGMLISSAVRSDFLSSINFVFTNSHDL